MILILSIVALIPSISFAQTAEKQTIRITLDVVKKNEKMTSIVGKTNLSNGEKIALELTSTLLKGEPYNETVTVENGQFIIDVSIDQSVERPIAYKIKASYYGTKGISEKPIAEGQAFFSVGTKKEEKSFSKKIKGNTPVVSTAPVPVIKSADICPELLVARLCLASMQVDYENLHNKMEDFGKTPNQQTLALLVEEVSSASKTSAEGRVEWCDSGQYQLIKNASNLTETSQTFNDFIFSVSDGMVGLYEVANGAPSNMEDKVRRLSRVQVSFDRQIKKLDVQLGKYKKVWEGRCIKEVEGAIKKLTNGGK